MTCPTTHNSQSVSQSISHHESHPQWAKGCDLDNLLLKGEFGYEWKVLEAVFELLSRLVLTVLVVVGRTTQMTHRIRVHLVNLHARAHTANKQDT
jgi:hypothetical protein